MLEYTSNNLRGNMAQRRMFSKEIFESDSFLKLSNNSKVVYVYLSLHSDDDGFSTSIKLVQLMLGLDNTSFQTSLNELEKANLLYIIDGVSVIRDWKKNNQIQKDRYHSTEFKSTSNKLILKDKIYYLKDVSNMDTDCILSIGKSSIGKSSIDKESKVELREGVETSLNEPQSFKEGTELSQKITPGIIQGIDSKHVLNDNDINYLCGYIKDNHIEKYVPCVLEHIQEKEQK